MNEKVKFKINKKRRAVLWHGNGRRLIILAIGGALAGFFNGLLGAGGGIVLVLTLSSLLPKDGEGRRSVYANALLVMLPLSCLTLFRYIRGGALSGAPENAIALPLVIGAVLGGISGGLLLGRIKGRPLKLLFALLTLVSGIIMLTR